jgi:YegS/Rv2252/BmrU family lipid kinase
MGRRLRTRIERAMRAAGAKFDLAETTGPGHALGLARDAAHAGVERIICAGGDGTVHEAANGLLQGPRGEDGATRTALGTIPIGTGNDFAKLLGVFKLPPETAAMRMAHAEPRRFDVGRVIGEHFVNSLGIGFDAEAVRQSNKITRLKGIAVYLVAVYKTFVLFRAPVLEVKSEVHSETGPMMMLECSIGVSAGGGFYLTPQADPSDGLLDICLIRKVGLLQFLRDVPRVLKGTHITLDEVAMFRTASLTIRSTEAPLLLHLDGELREPEPRQIEVTLEPKRLRALVGR